MIQSHLQLYLHLSQWTFVNPHLFSFHEESLLSREFNSSTITRSADGPFGPIKTPEFSTFYRSFTWLDKRLGKHLGHFLDFLTLWPSCKHLIHVEDLLLFLNIYILYMSLLRYDSVRLLCSYDREDVPTSAKKNKLNLVL